MPRKSKYGGPEGELKRRTTLMETDGRISEQNYFEFLIEMEHALQDELLRQVRRKIVDTTKYNTSRDVEMAFESMKEWLIDLTDSIIDKDTFWKKQSAIKGQQMTKNQRAYENLNNCVEESGASFNKDLKFQLIGEGSVKRVVKWIILYSTMPSLGSLKDLIMEMGH
jgi:hypothetical protein